MANISSSINNDNNKSNKYINILNNNQHTGLNSHIEEYDPKNNNTKPIREHANTETEEMNFTIDNSNIETRIASDLVDYINKESDNFKYRINELNSELNYTEQEISWLSYEIYGDWMVNYQSRDILDAMDHDKMVKELEKRRNKLNQEWRQQTIYNLVHNNLYGNVTNNQQLENYLHSLSDEDFHKYIANNNIQPTFSKYIENKLKVLKEEKENLKSSIELNRYFNTLLTTKTYEKYMDNLINNPDFEENCYDKIQLAFDEYWKAHPEPPETANIHYRDLYDNHPELVPFLKIYNSEAYRYASQKEKKVICYIFNTQGAEAANAFFDSYFENIVMKEEGMKRANDFINSITPYDVNQLDYINEIKARDDFEELCHNPIENISNNDYTVGATEPQETERGYRETYEAYHEQYADLWEFMSLQHPGIANLSEEEKKVIYYIYNTEGMDKVREIYNNPDISDIGKTIKTHIKGITDGVENFGEGMYDFLGGMDGKKNANQYEAAFIMMYLQENETQFLQGDYEISSSIGNMLPTIAVSTLLSCCGAEGAVPEVVASTLMGMSAAGNAMEEAYQEGHGKLESIIYGLINGASEATLGYFLGGIPGISKLSNNSLKGIAGMLANMLSEGIEESTQEIVDVFLRQICFGEDTFNPEVIAKAGIYGFITAGIMNGGNAIINDIVIDVYSIINDVKLFNALKSMEKSGETIYYEYLNNPQYRASVISRDEHMAIAANLKRIINLQDTTNVDSNKRKVSGIKALEYYFNSNGEDISYINNTDGIESLKFLIHMYGLDEVRLAFEAEIKGTKSIRAGITKAQATEPIKNIKDVIGGYLTNKQIKNLNKVKIIVCKTHEEFVTRCEKSGLVGGAKGFAISWNNTIVLPPNYDNGTLIHELLHCTGDCTNKTSTGFNETVTEFITKWIEPTSTSGYDEGVELLSELFIELNNYGKGDLIFELYFSKDNSKVKEFTEIIDKVCGPGTTEQLFKDFDVLNNTYMYPGVYDVDGNIINQVKYQNMIGLQKIAKTRIQATIDKFRMNLSKYL